MISSDGPSPTAATPKPRFATETDIDRILTMAEDFFNVSPYKAVEFDREAVRVLLSHLRSSGCLIVTDNGFIAGALTPLFFSPSVKVAAELAWWAPDGGGEELKTAFETWAKDNGADAVQMSTLNNPFAARLAKRLTDNGYTPVEVGYLKAL